MREICPVCECWRDLSNDFYCLCYRVSPIAEKPQLDRTDYKGIVAGQVETINNLTAEITRLKEQLARTERERDQATKEMTVEGETIIFKGIRMGDIRMRMIVGNKTQDPDLYAHLAGKVEG